MKRDYLLYFASAAFGAAVWIAITQASGRREAWDSELYFIVGVPAMCIVAFLFALRRPKEWLLWGILPLAGQFFWLLISQGVGNLLPLGVIAFGVMSVPSVVAARIGAAIVRRRGAH